MRKIAFYGKGGIGKSTTCTNIAMILAKEGHRVLQIGCDPKEDSTLALHPDTPLKPILYHLLRNPQSTRLQDVILETEDGIFCAEAGGPTPGLGCAGRGITMALEFLKDHNATKHYNIDCVLYDVLGDVVCGGFAVPMVTSGEPMSLYATQCIANAIANFQGRGYAKLGGLVMMEKELENEEQGVHDMALSLRTSILGQIHKSPLVSEAAAKKTCVMKEYPTSDLARDYMTLTQNILDCIH